MPSSPLGSWGRVMVTGKHHFLCHHIAPHLCQAHLLLPEKLHFPANWSSRRREGGPNSRHLLLPGVTTAHTSYPPTPVMSPGNTQSSALGEHIIPSFLPCQCPSPQHLPKAWHRGPSLSSPPPLLEQLPMPSKTQTHRLRACNGKSQLGQNTP